MCVREKERARTRERERERERVSVLARERERERGGDRVAHLVRSERNRWSIWYDAITTCLDCMVFQSQLLHKIVNLLLTVQ